MIRARQLLIGLASGSALYSGLAPALGLGEITLHSALNQSLDAEIELLELGDLADVDFKVRLAPAEVFSRSGVDRIYFLNDLRFTPLLRGGSGVIRVVSSKPVREPYLNFIVEVARPNGNLFREYTLLLDPPGSSAYRAVASTAAPAMVAPAPTLAPRAASQPSPATPRARQPMPIAERGERYQVVPGDSLWKIAARLREQGSRVSQQALMADIHVLNPQAFSNGDLNRLLAGVDLLLPDTAIGAVASAATDPSPVAEPASKVAAIEAPVESVAAEQTRVEQELSAQVAETLQLQQQLAELQLQVQQLQEQMSTRDRVISGLQADLAARQANAASVLATAAADSAAPLTAAGGEPATARNWLSAGLAVLALLLAGLVGLLWRSRSREQPAASPHQAPAPTETATAPTPRRFESAVPSVPGTYSGDALHSAETYIAYGRFNEAASCLSKALQTQPARSDIRWRLLEVLAQEGDVGGFLDQEAILRNSGFTPARIDELKTRFAHLFAAPPTDLLTEAVLELDEAQPEAETLIDDFKLNLDELSLDADWESLDPFAPSVKKKAAQPTDAAINRTQGGAALPDSPDARNPFADAMLVEEAPIDSWLGEELDPSFIEQTHGLSNILSSNLDHLAGNRSNLAKLNMALAYIENGSLDSACHILNELIHDGDEKLKQEARALLAKIA